MIEDMQKSENGKIENLIYEVRGQYVMLDSDLARLFEYKGGTKVLNQAFKRNIEHFSEESYFQLTDEELVNLMSQRATLKSQSVTSSQHGGSRKGHILFSKEGIKILSTILRKQNVQSLTKEIINVFENLERKNNKVLAIPVSKGERIENLIYNIRGQQVMLDFDLARIYECKNGTKTVVQAFKRNIDRFPDDFYFQLTEEEFLNLKSQSGTSSWNSYGGVRKLPYAFTEPGVYTLASILRTPIANKITSTIMRTFAVMRRYVNPNIIEADLYYNQTILNSQKIETVDKKVDKLSNELKEFKKILKEFQSKNKNSLTYYHGQIFDAHIKISEIMSEAKKNLIIIDRFADLSVLEMISKVKINVTLIRGDNNKLNKVDIVKYNTNYNNLTVIINDSFHDRYMIVDKKIIYHLGTSLNDAGTRTFSINKWEDEIIIKAFLRELDKII